MRKLWLTTLTIIACVSTASAQMSSKMEYSFSLSHALQKSTAGTLVVSEGGDSFAFQPCSAEGADALGGNLDRIYCDRRDFHGFNLGAKYNLSPALGIRTDFAAYFNKDRAVDPFGSGADAHIDTNTINEKTYVLVIGPEVRRDFGSWRPFAHALGGVARQTSTDVQTSTGPVAFTIRDRATSLALKVGGGIDVRISPRVDLRLIEVDYEPIFAKDRNTPVSAFFEQRVKGKTAQNVTLSVGLVWH